MRVIVSAGMLLAVLAIAGNASAATFCVASPPGCSGTPEADLAAALSAAEADTTAPRDRIELGAYTDTVAATDNDNSAVDIVGSGAATVLAGGTTKLTINEETSIVSNLSVSITGNSQIGILANGEVRDVSITATGDVDFTFGVQLKGNGKLIGGRIILPTHAANPPTTNGNVGVNTSSPAGTRLIDGTTIEATRGILGTPGPTTVRNARIRARTGVGATDSQVVVEDSLVEVLPHDPAASTPPIALASTSALAASSLKARHVTLVGPGASSPFSVGAKSQKFPGAPNPTLDLVNTIVSGFETDLQQMDGTLSANWSRWSTSNVTISGTNNTTAPPSFVNPPARDFRLLAASAMIDGGDPAGLEVGEPTTDLDGNPRLVNGRTDIGAFEYQRRAPTAVASAPGSAEVGADVTFDGTGSSDPDPGDTLTYAWSFDDGATASGPTAVHAFATPGPHVTTLTVTDPLGLTAAATAPVSVATTPVPPPPGPGPGPAPPVGGSILSFSMLRSSFAVGSAATPTTAKRKKPPVGSAFRFRLSRAASVRIKIEALLPGRISRGRCVKPARSLAKARKCTRAVAQTPLSRSGKAGDNTVPFSGRIGSKALAPGRYRATLLATAPFTATSRPVSFTILTP